MELLVAIAIIGVVAALTAPALMNMMPDKTKMQVVKIHKIICEINKELIEDPLLFQDTTEIVGGVDKDKFKGFQNTENPRGGEYATGGYSGNAKYAKLLASKLRIEKFLTYKAAAESMLRMLYWYPSDLEAGKHKDKGFDTNV